MLNFLKNNKNKGKVILFSDEKILTINAVFNPQNDRYISSKIPENVFCTKQPAGTMVLGVVASTGDMCLPIFVEHKERLNSKSYIDLLQNKVIPWAKDKFGDNFVFTQDGAPCHTAKATQQFLAENCPEFWDKTM